MKVTFKTVTGANFSLELQGTEKIVAVKQTIEEKQGTAFPAGSLVVIHQGKVLKDESTLADNNVSETGFMVVMVSKAKKPEAAAQPAAPPPPPAPRAAEPAAEPAAPAPAPAAAAPAAPEAAPAAPAAPAAAAEPAAVAEPELAGPERRPAAAAAGGASGTGNVYSDTASQLSVGAVLENHINQIVEMGFDREEVKRAMRAAFNNPDRAVDYLMNGIPESAEPPPPVAAPAPAQGGPPAGGAATPAAAGDAAAPASESAPAQSGPNAQPLDMFAPQTPLAVHSS